MLLVFAAVLASALVLLTPVSAAKGVVMDNLRIEFYGGTTPLFTALVAGSIDFMGWPLSKSEYSTAMSYANITVIPYFGMDAYEIAFNNNYSLPSQNWRNPFNYTVFRQACACLVDKDGLIAGPQVNGWGTRIDTMVPRPMLDDWVEFSRSEYDSTGVKIGNYPWEYNVTKALELLYNNGWFNTSVYPSFAALLTAYINGDLLVRGGTTGGVIYPPGHEKAGLPLDMLIAYLRTDIPALMAGGSQLITAINSIGIWVDIREGGAPSVYPAIYVDHDYNFGTVHSSLGYRTLFDDLAGGLPVWYESMYTPKNIRPGGMNYEMIDDSSMSASAQNVYSQATTLSNSKASCKICQQIEVDNAFDVPLLSYSGYAAYRTGIQNAVTTKGYGLTRGLDYLYMACYDQNYPAVNTIYYGTEQAPIQINPLFSTMLSEYQVVDRMFCTYMAINPYKPNTPGKSPAGGDQPWMAKDWQTFIDSDGNMTLELWFRHDITWHDGEPFTVADLDYTITLGQTYTDSWSWSDMMHMLSFTTIDNWHCKVHFDMPSCYCLYTCAYPIVPKHIYEKIDTDPYPGTGGHRGYWPGRDCTPDQILTGAPFTWSQLTGTGGERYVLVGTNMWQYIPGTLVEDIGGGISFSAYPGFWMSYVPGDVDYNYYWNPGTAPQGGHYSIGLSDLVFLANAYGKTGTPPSSVPFKLPGEKGAWNPAADLAKPAGVIGLSDLVTLARDYGMTWGTYP
jgi:ABC-type transport system substrate-binding protein